MMKEKEAEEEEEEERRKRQNANSLEENRVYVKDIGTIKRLRQRLPVACSTLCLFFY